jgi:exopolysaccharide biosynthesis WecB/TagA/CpsF family protein
LQIFYTLAHKLGRIKTGISKLQNLNWTDFSLDFLLYLKNKFWKEKVNILLYGTHPEILAKSQKFLENQWLKILYAQDGYTNLNREKVNTLISNNPGEINILLVARTTPVYPIQEIRSRANQDKVKDNKLIVMNQWGTFDFWAWIQKRAPKIVRKLKLERLRRVTTDPKRNLKKVKDSLALFTYIFTYLLLKKR